MFRCCVSTTALLVLLVASCDEAAVQGASDENRLGPALLDALAKKHGIIREITTVKDFVLPTTKPALDPGGANAPPIMVLQTPVRSLNIPASIERIAVQVSSREGPFKVTTAGLAGRRESVLSFERRSPSYVRREAGEARFWVEAASNATWGHAVPLPPATSEIVFDGASGTRLSKLFVKLLRGQQKAAGEYPPFMYKEQFEFWFAAPRNPRDPRRYWLSPPEFMAVVRPKLMGGFESAGFAIAESNALIDRARQELLRLNDQQLYLAYLAADERALTTASDADAAVRCALAMQIPSHLMSSVQCIRFAKETVYVSHGRSVDFDIDAFDAKGDFVWNGWIVMPPGHVDAEKLVSEIAAMLSA